MQRSFTLMQFVLLISVVYDYNIAYSYSPLINKLEYHINNDVIFADLVNKSLIAAGYNSISFKDIYNYFESNIHTVPHPLNWCFKIAMVQVTSKTKIGADLSHTQYYQNWIRDYMIKRGDFCWSPKSKYIIPFWESWSKINMSQYIIPNNGFNSFNDFFSRKIKPETHPIQSPNNNSVIISPCDGTITLIRTNLSFNQPFKIKNATYNLQKMFDGSEYAKNFIGGTAISISLARYNYHRFHSSVDGNIISTTLIDGCFYYWPLWKQDHNESIDVFNPCQENCNDPAMMIWSSCNNQRGVLVIDNNELGYISQIFVGLGSISSVNIDVNDGDFVNKGDNVGYFAMGGSEIVVLFQKDVIQTINVQISQTIRMGQQIATAISRNINMKQQQIIINNNNHTPNLFTFFILFTAVAFILYYISKICCVQWKRRDYQHISTFIS